MKAIFAASVVALSAFALQGQALGQSAYPEAGKPIRLIIGFGAGGGTDIAGRLMAEAMEKELGTPVVVENVVGGGGLVGVNQLLASEADGYTLALVPLPATNMLYLDKERGGQFTLDDVEVIGMHDYGPVAIAVGANSPYQTLEDLVAAAKANPNTLTSASGGVLAAGHLALLRLQQEAEIQLNWTAMDSLGMIISNLVGGHIDLATDTFVELLPSYQNKDTRFLAVLSAERQADYPEVPTARDAGIDVVLTTNRVIIAPDGTPQEAIDRIEEVLAKITSDPAYQAAARERQLQLNYLTAEDATALWMEFDETYAPLVQSFRSQQ